MASKSKRFFLWFVFLFIGIPLFFAIIGFLMGGSEDELKSASQCQIAQIEDIENISSGMTEDGLSIESGYVATLPEKEIDAITAIFPSYTNPRIVSAVVQGVPSSKPIGLWAIQQVTDSGSLRITALNSVAREFSVWGSAANDGSAAAQLRDQLLESSKSTNAESCAESEE